MKKKQVKEVDRREIEDGVVEALHDEFVRGEVREVVQEALCNEFQCLQDVVSDLRESVHESLGVPHSVSTAPDSLADRLDRVEAGVETLDAMLTGLQRVLGDRYKDAAFKFFDEGKNYVEVAEILGVKDVRITVGWYDEWQGQAGRDKAA